jgi:hypothetical protein
LNQAKLLRTTMRAAVAVIQAHLRYLPGLILRVNEYLIGPVVRPTLGVLERAAKRDTNGTPIQVRKIACFLRPRPSEKNGLVFLIVSDDEVEAPLRGLVGYLPASDFARRKAIPAAPIKPVLSRNSDEGSGVGAMF